MTALRCASCATAPAHKVVSVSVDGHAIIMTGTGLASACSGDGGYYPRESGRVFYPCGCVSVAFHVGPSSVVKTCAKHSRASAVKS